jgi:predicted permease
MQREMAEHLDRATSRLVARGMSPRDARAASIREFGNMTYLKEEGRRAHGVRWLEALAADSRFAIRHFRRNPGATATILFVLAIGMSISTALFSFIHGYVNQPPRGVTASDDLVRIRGRDLRVDGLTQRQFTAEELGQYQGLTSHFAAVAGYATYGVALYLNSDGRSESGKATFVTPNYFDLLGIRPFVGAGLPRPESAEAGSPLVAVVGYGVWERFFSRSPSAIGATLTVDGAPVTIVGVASPRFLGLDDFSEMMVWMPIASRTMIFPRARPGAAAFSAVARLAPGTDRQRATAAAEVIAQRVTAAAAQTQPSPAERRVGTDVVPLLATNHSPEFDSEPVGMGIAASVLGALILLITCTNVSALQTGLGLMRRREIAIRLSMGASRRRIVRQLLTETVILATLAGGAGLGIVWLIQRLLVTRVPDMAIELAVSAPALAFAFGLALAVGTLFGLSPALHATRLTVSSALKDSTGAIAAPRVRLQRALVVAQVALTQPLIVVLGVVMAVLYAEYRYQGLDQSGEQIVSVRLRAAAAHAADSAPQWAGEIRGLRDRLRSTPSIEGVVQELWFGIDLENYVVHPDDRVGATSEQPLELSAEMVAPGYFGVMGKRVVLGRDFTEGDRTPALDSNYAGIAVPVVIGSDLASDVWPGANPLGRRLQYAPDPARGGPPLTVIGVLEPRPRNDIISKYEPYGVFVPPDSARAASSLAMTIRTSGDGRPLIPTIRRVVQEGTSRLVITDTRTVAEMDQEARDQINLAASGLGSAGFLTLLLAAIGLYAVVSFAVGQRTSEIAVRMAVGATERRIVARFIGEGVKLGIVGLVIGLPLSLVGLRIVSNTFSGPPVPIAEIAVVAGIGVLAVALAATWVPARRAAGVNPATVLRRD